MNHHERTRVFQDIFFHNRWRGKESASGRGSDLNETEGVREGLIELVQGLNVRSLLDAACGDFNWMKSTGLSLDKYIGMDIVAPLISINNQLYGDAIREFRVGDIVQDVLPRVDAILCRDCLNHLVLRDGARAVQNFKASGSKYLIATNFPDLAVNNDEATWALHASEANKDHFETGDWRKLNLELSPFDLGEPLRTIQESGLGLHFGKVLGVWDLEQG